MQITTSYPVRLSHLSSDQVHHLNLTQILWNEALDFLTPIVHLHWDDISSIDTSNNQHARRDFVDALIHRTKNNPNPKYPGFDKKFHKMPAYLRRALMTAVIGHVSSHMSNLDNWRTGGSHGNQPSLGKCRAECCFYDANMFMWDAGCPPKARIKLYNGKDWYWSDVNLRLTDVKYIKRHCEGKMIRKAPVIQHRGKVWALRFAFEMNSALSDAKVCDRVVCAVDLGVNTAATMSVMKSDGTVIGREFIKLSSDEARLHTMLGKLRKSQAGGAKRLRRKWKFINDLNAEIARKTMNAIIDVAIKYSCDVIVFEYLDMTGKLRGSRKHRLSIWRKREVQRLVEGRAHRWGMRFSRVCAWSTSRLAFDGSGRCLRGREIEPRDGKTFGYSTVEFSSGKLYNADLNASYNIGAVFHPRDPKSLV